MLTRFYPACLLLSLFIHSAGATGVRPQDDLFLAANGAWLARTSIPPDRSEVYAADLPASVNARVRGLVEDLRRHPQAPGSIGRKLLDFHDSYLDLDAIERAGLAPVLPLLADIDGVQDAAALARWQGTVQGVLQTPLWFWGGFADFKDPGLNRALVMQGGLGLPERDYYLKDDARTVQARDAYRDYLTTLARLAGEADPAQAANAVLALETRLAGAHLPPLLLQILVENAVRHGIEPLRAGGGLTVTAFESGSHLRFTVVNDTPPRQAGASGTGLGIGMRNIAQRLELLYGAAATHAVHATPGRHEVQLTLPRERA